MAENGIQKLSTKDNIRRYALVVSLGLSSGFMYVMPYMKQSFYDQMITAMGVTNAQLGSLLTFYTLFCSLSYVPGGWIADRFKPKPVLLISVGAQFAVAILFMFTYKSYVMACIVWAAMGLTGGFAYWPALMKGVRMAGTDKEQGRLYGLYEGTNGVAALILSFIMVGIIAAASNAADPEVGFRTAIFWMGALSGFSGILIAIIMPKDAAYGATEEQKTEHKKFNKNDYFDALKNPGTWLICGLVFTITSIHAITSYLTPYCTEILGMSATLITSISILRFNGARIIGCPLGGFISEKKSTSLEQFIANALMLVTLVIFMFLKPGANEYLIAVLLILCGMGVAMGKTYYSIQPEVGITTKNAGTAIAMSTFLGYLPDMFVHPMLGAWLDKFGAKAYDYIFAYGIITLVIGLIIATISMRYAKKIAAAKLAAAN